MMIIIKEINYNNNTNIIKQNTTLSMKIKNPT